jgi:riboflavin kinase/FMN adenylyltransferase
VDGKHMLLEIHLFEFSREIYGHYININFLQKLRDEQRFASLDELKTHIHGDIDAAHAWFAAREQSGRVQSASHF